MVKNKINFNNKKRVIAISAAAMASLLVISIATIGAAPFSYQQASDRQGPRITSANIVDGEVRNEDLAPDAVTSDKIKNGEVKEEDLDPSIVLGGSDFSLQVTERSNSATFDEGAQGGTHLTISVQCNSDEIVTGGGYGSDPNNWNGANGDSVIISKKQDNGWTVTWDRRATDIPNAVYAECLKVVNEGTTG